MRVFITGVSGGLGEALVKQFLARHDSVTGIGRNNTIQHPNYTFLSCDLSSAAEIKKLDFGSINEDVILINNAGIIGQIERLSDQEIPDAESVFMVNTLAPMFLSAKLMRSTSIENQVTIINISSGAARRSIPSWAAYCASKAALDRFSETFYLEEKEKGRNIRVYSVAPGVIDTKMQELIRTSKPANFSSVSRFTELKSTNSLKTPQETAEQLIQLVLQADFDESNIICSL
jgi:benzil reductase ((S)-benzoin forming)